MQLQKLPPLKCRASSATQIMGVKGLGLTGYGFVENWYKEQLYSRRKTFGSKQMLKGTIQEDPAIEFVADHFGYGEISKNETWFENEYVTGTPDLILNDRIIDIKCSWSAFTFPLFAKSDDTYKLQMQVYLALTGKPLAQVIYCLMDAPDNLIESEAWKQARALGLDEVPAELFEEIKADMTYSHLPNELRIKSFDIPRDEEVISKIYARVKECREYLDTIILNGQVTTPAEPVTGSTINVVGGLELDWK